MKIKLGSTYLCGSATSDGDARRSDGTPMGPRDVRVGENPGVTLREYIGADRVDGEHVRCDSGTVTFGVTRVFASESAAAAYALVGHRAEAKEGAFTVEGVGITGNVVYAHAVCSSKQISHVGCAVAVNYTIQG